MKEARLYFSVFVFFVNVLFASLFITEGIQVSAIFSYLYFFLMVGYLGFTIITIRRGKVK